MSKSAKPRIIDLTLPINPEMAGVEITQAKTVKDDGWNATYINIYSHCGTHMDAPWHFEVNEQTIDELPLDRLISDAWIWDLQEVGPKEILGVQHLKKLINDFKKGDSMLLRTGWSKRLGTDDYRNALPRIGEDLAHWMGENKVNILGVEPPSVADVNNLEEVTKIHQILMQHDIIIVEGLTNLDAITKPIVKLIALPLKVENCDGAPARVIAIEE
jgi:kynurenine formamidase